MTKDFKWQSTRQPPFENNNNAFAAAEESMESFMNSFDGDVSQSQNSIQFENRGKSISPMPSMATAATSLAAARTRPTPEHAVKTRNALMDFSLLNDDNDEVMDDAVAAVAAFDDPSDSLIRGQT